MNKKINKLLSYFGVKLIRIKNKPNLAKEIVVESSGATLNSTVQEPYNQLPFSGEALEKLIASFNFQTVLDIGSGEGKHSDVLKARGKKVTSIDFGNSIYFDKRTDNHTCIVGDYYTYNFEEPFDAIWASHVLEHQPNPNLFLKKIFSDLKEGGVLAITVPPLKHEIVGGHVTLWNAGLLLYQLVMAGFNCKDVFIKSYGYNISVILNKKSIDKYPDLSYDSGDILKMKDFFPSGFGEPFDGDIKELNWK
ncbi:class I SAM-dependent methyltransferase [Mariniflexile litorale]|uniref:Class I SAM-dependent methyltransferase n=1 Tax=Mariniflexile litorale TaxID=3045158 RepID=A0AAU7EDR6_9FLAO|nr:class I SAM-dependent methyltransferase [Mariniflexile sp. KMM 9835]MDQ8212228.1 class I SAM-dependent methyltransferase [Mariniflexile sp. KMM 9835]